MIERYLVKSEQLKVIFLLVDIRHEPTANDVGMYEFIKSTGFKPVIIATKLDKIKRSQLTANVKVIRNKLKLENDVPVIPFSATTKQGREEIYEVMESFINCENV